ncbi:hypothetical protein FA15DRAFT_754415 [Coprinopsis marcescibilis]|uniref:F-box domain-containing protein n=1 Tax=Coprinopsis marcescibilis TaxID=230819 RepID=A0A5C3LFL5_COPMA|nr:hypothetical protein FA15DRAFT_754415 [Coprinopsis marcescibilis]
MSLRVSWRSTGDTASEDVAMDDAQTPWSTTLGVWTAGRQLSNWLFPKPSHIVSFPSLTSATQQNTTPHNFHHAAPSSWSHYGSNEVVIDNPSYQMQSKHHVNTIPVELLGEIFVHYSRITDDLPSSRTRPFGCIAVTKNAINSPITLGRVCSYWRALSLSMPTLWSSISVHRPTPRDVPIFSEWLARSGSCPLDLTVVQISPEEGLQDVAIQQILHLAISQRQRWRHLSLYLYSNVESIFSSLEGNAFDRLEGLELDVIDWTHGSASQLCRAFYSSPNLKQIRFENSWSHQALLSEAPWERLQIVDIGIMDSTQLFPLLSRAVNLQRLSISCLAGPTKGQIPEKLRLPNLSSFGIRLVDDVANIFENLLLPSLSELQLRGGFGRSANPKLAWTMLQGCLLASGSKIRTLYCAQMAKAEDTLIEMLSSPIMSDIVSLTLQSRITNATLLALSCQNSALILPRMQTLMLWAAHPSGNAFSSMVLSRRRYSSNLSFVHAVLFGKDAKSEQGFCIPGLISNVTHQY